MRRTLFFSVFFLACGPAIEPSQPFIHVTLTEPAGFTAPVADQLEFTTTSTVGGDILTRDFVVDITDNALPTDFVILFTESVRGEAVDVVVTGTLAGVNVYSALGSAVADTSELTMAVSFCGDEEIDATRQEECDDGVGNSDDTPNACRSDCRLPVCGDGVIDSDTEQCDDENSIDADGCEADCSLPACGNGIFEPEDFNDENLGGSPTGCFVPNGQSFTLPDKPYEILVVDFNQDGNLDIVTGFFFSELISIFLGNGDGTFQQPNLIPVPSSSFTISVSDFSDLDDFPDFIIGETPNSQSQTAKISHVINVDGNVFNLNSFLVDDFVPACGGLCTISDVVAGNLDTDQLDEIAFSTGGAVLLLESNSPNPGFGPGLASGTQRHLIRLKDLNLDGNEDLIGGDLVSGSQSQIVINPGNGNRTFQPAKVVNFGISSGFILGLNNNIAFVDFDNDGLDDILSCVVDFAGMNVIFVDLNLSLNNNNQLLMNNSCFLLQTGDFDGDSKDDILFLKNIQDQTFSTGESGFGLLLSTEGFQFDRDFTSSGSITATTSLGIGDFNKDGISDLVVGGFVGGENKIEVLLFDE